MIPKDYKYRPLPKGLTIKPSKIDGLGLFSNTNIKKGEFLGRSHLLVDNVLIREPLGGFINDSNNPNAECRKVDNEYFLYTIKNIPKDTELTVDYSKTLNNQIKY